MKKVIIGKEIYYYIGTGYIGTYINNFFGASSFIFLYNYITNEVTAKTIQLKMI